MFLEKIITGLLFSIVSLSSGMTMFNVAQQGLGNTYNFIWFLISMSIHLGNAYLIGEVAYESHKEKGDK